MGSSGGGHTEQKYPLILPEQWFEAQLREEMDSMSRERLQSAAPFWDMSLMAAGLSPRGDWFDSVSTGPKGNFEWTIIPPEYQNQVSNYGIGGGGAERVGGGLSGLWNDAGNKTRITQSPWELGYNPSEWTQRGNDENGSLYWTRNSGTGNSLSARPWTPSAPPQMTPADRVRQLTSPAEWSMYTSPNQQTQRYLSGGGVDGLSRTQGTPGGRVRIPEIDRGDTDYVPGKKPGVQTGTPIPAWQSRLGQPMLQDLGKGLLGMDRALVGARGSLDTSNRFLEGAKNSSNMATGSFGQMSAPLQQMSGALGKMGVVSGELADLGRTGELPASVMRNWTQGTKRSLDQSIGSALNDLAGRGIVNSSVTSRTTGRLAGDAADAASRNYLEGISTIGNTLGGAISGYGQQAQGYGNQAQGYYNQGMGHVSNAQTQIGGANSAQGQAGSYMNLMSAEMQPFQTRLDASKDLMGLGDNMMSPATQLYELWRKTRYAVPGDTIAYQGGK